MPRVCGSWFHGSIGLWSTDAEHISALQVTIMNAVPHNRTDVYSEPNAFYTLTYGEGCDALKVAVVPIALKRTQREMYSVFAAVGASDGFSVATLVAMARRMGNAVRLLLLEQDYHMSEFQVNRAEIKAVVTFTRRSLAEPDMVHGALSEAFVDCVFDTTRPFRGSTNMQSLQAWAENESETNPLFEVRWIKGAVLCGNYVINAFEDHQVTSVSKSVQVTASGWDAFLYLARVFAAFKCDRQLMEHSTHLENEIIHGEDAFRHTRIFRDDVLHTVLTEEEAALQADARQEETQAGGGAAASSSPAPPSASSPSPNRQQQQQQPQSSAFIDADEALESRRHVSLSQRPADHLCDVTGVTGELVRGLDDISSAIFADSDNIDADCHPELRAMLQSMAHRFHDAPEKYERYASAVQNEKYVDSNKLWGDSETAAVSNIRHQQLQQRRQEAEQQQNNQQQQDENRNNNNNNNDEPASQFPALHVQVTCPLPEAVATLNAHNTQFWLSFKYVDFTEIGVEPGGGADDAASVGSDGAVIALFSSCMRFTPGPATQRPARGDCRTTNNGFASLLDEISARMAATAIEQRNLPSEMWSFITSSRAAETFFGQHSPNLLAIDVVDRSLLLDPLNARLKMQFWDDIDVDGRSVDLVSSSLVPRLLRVASVQEHVDLAARRAAAAKNASRAASVASAGGSGGNSNQQQQQRTSSPTFSSANVGGQNDDDEEEEDNHALLDLMDSFRRSISRAHQMFATGCVEGCWSTPEGSFCSGLFLTRRGHPNGAPTLVTATPKHLQQLCSGNIVPTAQQHLLSQQQGLVSGGGGGGGIGGDGGNNNSPANSAGNGGATSSSSAMTGGVNNDLDIPIARMYVGGARPPDVVPRPEQANESVPLGLLEVHCMFTPNTEMEVMASEMFQALYRMNAFNM